MAVNVTANWRLIRSLDPLLRQSDAGRALFVTSGGRAASAGPIGASTRSRRRRSRRWSGPTPASSRQTERRANLLNPGPTADAHARAGDARRGPGDAASRRRRSSPDIVRMLSPDFAENGALFDFPTAERSLALDASRLLREHLTDA